MNAGVTVHVLCSQPRRMVAAAGVLALLVCGAASAGPAVTFSEDGTVHVVDLTVPIPPALSPEAHKALRNAAQAGGDSSEGLTAPLEELRKWNEERTAKETEQLLKMYPSTVEKKVVGGVPVALVTPRKLARAPKDALLINVHGGAFFLGQGDIAEAIPIATLAGVPVLAIDYRLAPEHPFPAAVDDTIAVYRELLKTHNPLHMALYGSSAGAVLTAEASVRARQLKLPLPGALGFFSGTVDFNRPGDTEALFSLGGFAKLVTPVATQAHAYLGSTPRTDPVLSPAYADMHGFPPTLLMSGTRDFFLSGTANFQRQLLAAGVPTQLVVFDAMPHVHWGMYSDLPESHEAWAIQARFLAQHIGVN